MANFESLRDKTRKDGAIILSFSLAMLFFFLLHDSYRTLAWHLFNRKGPPDDLLRTWAIVLVPIVAPVAFYVIAIFTIAKRDIHYSIDNLFPRTRDKIDHFICEKMLDFEKVPRGREGQALSQLKGLIDHEDKRRKVMHLFYSYIEKEAIVNPELKSQAFEYWGDYFSHLTATFLGIITLLCMGGIWLFDQEFDWVRASAVGMTCILAILNGYSLWRGKAVKKLLQIPEAQIREIHRNADLDLLEDLRREGFFLR